MVAKDFTQCEQALLPVYDTITKAMDDFKSGVCECVSAGWGDAKVALRVSCGWRLGGR